MAKAVKYRFLGQSGLKVSEICFGTSKFATKEGPEAAIWVEEKLAHKLLDRFAELGGNFIDTADKYCGGESEEILGRWLIKQKREKFVITSKVWGDMDPSDPNALGLSRHHIMDNIDKNLKRLQTHYLDLYLMHLFDNGTPLEETLCAFNDLLKMGKIRYFGVSNVKGWQLQKIVDITQKYNWAPVIVLEQKWNLLYRGLELEVIDVCRNEGIGLLPWSPLGSGWLTGKIKPDGTMQNATIAWVTEKKCGNWFCPSFDMENNARTWRILSELEKIAGDREKTIAQVALRWLLDKDVVPSVVMGVVNIGELEENMAASGEWTLTDKETEILDKASTLELFYPYDLLVDYNEGRNRQSWMK